MSSSESKISATAPAKIKTFHRHGLPFIIYINILPDKVQAPHWKIRFYNTLIENNSREASFFSPQKTKSHAQSAGNAKFTVKRTAAAAVDL